MVGSVTPLSSTPPVPERPFNAATLKASIQAVQEAMSVGSDAAKVASALLELDQAIQGARRA